MSDKPIDREAERRLGLELAGPLASFLDTVARDLHGNESMHMHNGTGPVERCGYCWLRAGRTLGIVAAAVPNLAQGDRCRNCGIHERSAQLFPTGDGRTALCFRCFYRLAPRGYDRCRLCGYEKPIGLPCGEPCV